MPRSTPPRIEALASFHAVFGLWSLVVFAVLGLALEALHGLKLGWYLAAGEETRRLLLTLAHAHGTLLSLLHVVVGLALRSGLLGADPPPTAASRFLVGASLLVPGGFFLGGFFPHDADAGLGILLVPVGALLLISALVQLARRAARGVPPPAARR